MLPKTLCLLFLLPPVVLSCYSDQFRCRNGDCITARYQCDGGGDCSDRSDEENCACTNGPSCYKPPPVCPPDQFPCSSGTCIPKNWECDGDFDCPDLSDEHSNCTQRTCDPYQFTCDNGGCIDAALKCNGRNDCGDNSDEAVCQIVPSGANHSELNDCGDAYKCEDGACVLLGQVCDGAPHCPDGSDESAHCPNSCADNECEHDHVRTPNGCLCTCRRGYRLAGDGLSCVDMLECSQDPPVCSQVCAESEGAFACKCFKEFTMRYDQVTCKSRGEPMAVYYGVRNEIRRYTPARRSLRVEHVDVLGNITAMDVDVSSGVLYYSIEGLEDLQQLTLANGTKKTVTRLGQIHRVAVDWITKNVYLTTSIAGKGEQEETPRIDRLQVCNFAGRNCAVLVETVAGMRALAVDPINRYLFYSTFSSNRDDGDAGAEDVRLYRAGLDGRFKTELAAFDRAITDIAVDYRQRFVYLARESGIERVDYKGGKIASIVGSLKRIKGLNVFEDRLHFLTEAGLTMHKCRLYGDARRCTSFRLSADYTDVFAIAQATRQTPGRNACANYNCSHVCVPNVSGASCLCKDGRVVDEESDCRE